MAAEQICAESYESEVGPGNRLRSLFPFHFAPTDRSFTASKWRVFFESIRKMEGERCSQLQGSCWKPRSR
jgi:hypothetical protein